MSDLIKAAIAEIEARYESGAAMQSPTQSQTYLRLQFAEHAGQEVFACLFLNNQNRVIEFRKLFFGDIAECAIYPRQVIKAALDCNAAAIILAHNHPSGILEPSNADKNITKRIEQAANLFEIRVLDHIIIGAGSYSFAENGLI